MSLAFTIATFVIIMYYNVTLRNAAKFSLSFTNITQQAVLFAVVNYFSLRGYGSVNFSTITRHFYFFTLATYDMTVFPESIIFNQTTKWWKYIIPDHPSRTFQRAFNAIAKGLDSDEAEEFGAQFGLLEAALKRM